MSIMTGPEIVSVVVATKKAKELVKGGVGTLSFLPRIDVYPFDPAMAGPNSYDVHLGMTLLRYDLSRQGWLDPLDMPPTVPVTSGDAGHAPAMYAWYLKPGVLYLGATAERVELAGVCATLTGRSSLGRLGVDCHVSAGLIDDGFAGNVTLEIRVVHPILLWPGMRFAQLVFAPVTGVRAPYQGRYQNDTGPVASRFHADGGR